jgi:hypothetical protein
MEVNLDLRSLDQVECDIRVLAKNWQYSNRSDGEEMLKAITLSGK